MNDDYMKKDVEILQQLVDSLGIQAKVEFNYDNDFFELSTKNLKNDFNCCITLSRDLERSLNAVVSLAQTFRAI